MRKKESVEVAASDSETISDNVSDFLEDNVCVSAGWVAEMRFQRCQDVLRWMMGRS